MKVVADMFGKWLCQQAAEVVHWLKTNAYAPRSSELDYVLDNGWLSCYTAANAPTSTELVA